MLSSVWDLNHVLEILVFYLSNMVEAYAKPISLRLFADSPVPTRIVPAQSHRKMGYHSQTSEG
jgi:hypothetical protein